MDPFLSSIAEQLGWLTRLHRCEHFGQRGVNVREEEIDKTVERLAKLRRDRSEFLATYSGLV